MATATKESGSKKKDLKIKEEPIILHEIDLRTLFLTLKGVTPLVVNRFSEKAKKMIEDKQQKKASKGRETRKPEEEFNAARYKINSKTDGFPATGFKKAAVRAGTYSDMKMTFLRGAFHIIGDLVPIKYKKIVMREDTVRLPNKSADMRYRPEYQDWSCEIEVRYNARAIAAEQIVNLFNVAGFAVGVGEWRPQNDGQFGMFEVAVNGKK